MYVAIFSATGYSPPTNPTSLGSSARINAPSPVLGSGARPWFCRIAIVACTAGVCMVYIRVVRAGGGALALRWCDEESGY